MAGVFGQAPAQIGMPDPFGDLSKRIPNLSGINTTASNTILSKLGGQLSPGTLQQIQNGAATYGVGSGMPGTGSTPGALSYNKGLATLGLTAEGQQEQGLKDYNSFVPTVSGTQTVNPALQNEINTQNAVDAAAPDPSSAANYAQGLYEHYLQSFGGNSKWASSQTQQPGAFRFNPTNGSQPGSASYSASPSFASPLGGSGVAVANGPAGQTIHNGQVVADSDLNAWLKNTYGINPAGGAPNNPNDDPTGNGD